MGFSPSTFTSPWFSWPSFWLFHGNVRLHFPVAATSEGDRVAQTGRGNYHLMAHYSALEPDQAALNGILLERLTGTRAPVTHGSGSEDQRLIH